MNERGRRLNVRVNGHREIRGEGEKNEQEVLKNQFNGKKNRENGGEVR